MNNLAQKSLIGSLHLIAGLGVMLFAPAWTFDFWQAWVYLFIFGTSVVLIFAYLYKNDAQLLERRLNRAEKEKSQQWIQFCIFMTYISMYVLPSLDRRFSWSSVPFSWVVLGDVLVISGYFIMFLALKENGFAAATIEVALDQKVISTGPYARMRHPMYLGALVMLLGTPLALGSWWGLLMVIPITFFIVLRLLNEEEFLSGDLPGYKEYCQKTKYRLVPFIW